ncbi:hypothetical protein ACIQAL_09995 [Pseudomonas sp. NPDC088368]|uniref:hypothetical protein n=1 Tax=Pseudomonas sp. NPDC088368 TaxID=3364453 RepID=UPI003819D664
MVEQYDRAKLLDEVWTEAVTIVAPRYQLSDVGLKKLCGRLQIPTPPRGYWARLKAGKSVPPRPKLREYVGHPMNLFRTTAPHTVVEPKPIDERLVPLLAFERAPGNQIIVPEHVKRWHPMTSAARLALKKPVIDTRGQPSTRAPALNICVSPALQDRALKLMDAVLKALETRGCRVEQGKQQVDILIMGRIYHLRAFEPCKRSPYVPTPKQLEDKARGRWSYWPNWTYQPTGQLHLLVNEGYAGKVIDSPNKPVEMQLNTLLEQIMTNAVEALVNAEQQAIVNEKRRQLREAAVERQRIQNDERKRLATLESDAQNWRRAQAIRDYLDALERSSISVPKATDRTDYVQWARAKADWLDPLIGDVTDILDEDIKVPY